ncbi:MAG TPA: phosphate acyltransferase PlsX [Candidatus Atribacteria bacterium]|nr:phosphate acyltransferase PlsX [Candidatus Atribacteria bacterium]
MKIALDAMGGDYAPEEVVKGAILALEERDLEIILLGDIGKIKKELMKYKYKKDKLSVIDCKEYIETGEFPLDAIRNKRDSSIVVGTKLIKNNQADAFISAGNSGAVMAAALLELGCVSEIRRPPIAAILPSAKGKVLVLDVGANVDCKPEHLPQFALIGSKYAKYILGIENPKIGLLNIGEEESKGNKFAQNAYKNLKNVNVNFVGNIEGKDIFKGKVDVVVCDGFTGNILLKSSEGLAKFLLTTINSMIISQLPQNQEMDKLKQYFMNLVKMTDYAEHGGSPLLGVNGLCFICHGRSKAKTYKNAILNTGKFIDAKLVEHFKEI